MPNDYHKQPLYLGPSGDPEDFNEPILLYPGQLGARMTVKQPGPPGAPGAEDYRHKTYQLVGTDSTMTVAPFPGAVAWWSDKANYKTTTSPTATARGNIAGVYGRTTITRGNYCFVQTRGPATVKHVDAPAGGAFAVGDSVIPSATAGKADRVAAGTAPTYPTLGLCSRVTNGNAEILADLDVPETV